MRTWFSSHIVMKRSKDRPLSTILNFWPVPNASAGARPARPTSNLYVDGMVALCCYGIFGGESRVPRWPFEMLSGKQGQGAVLVVSCFIRAPPAGSGVESFDTVASEGPWQWRSGYILDRVN